MSKVDKIVNTFTKTIKQLRAEATNRTEEAARHELFKQAAENKREECVNEAARALTIAERLENLVEV